MVGVAIFSMSGILSEEKNSNTQSLAASKRKVAKRKTDVERTQYGMVAGPGPTLLWTVPVGTHSPAESCHSGACYCRLGAAY